MKNAKRWCNYCKEKTKHKIEKGKGGNEAGQCLKCGSSGPSKIQGFNANLMQEVIMGHLSSKKIDGDYNEEG